MLTVEQKQLGDGNTKLQDENARLEAENKQLNAKIDQVIQNIQINNLLKDIDIEDLKLLAKNNQQMNYALESLITQWNHIDQRA